MGVNNNEMKLTIIGRDMQLTGELISSGDIRVDGKFDGELQTKGKIVVSKDGYVEGIIRGKDIVVQGKGRGDYEAGNNFQVSPGGFFEGSVKTRFINITESAFFNGTCTIFPLKDHPDFKINKRSFRREMSVSKIMNGVNCPKARSINEEKSEDDTRETDQFIDKKEEETPVGNNEDKSVVNSALSRIRSL